MTVSDRSGLVIIKRFQIQSWCAVKTIQIKADQSLTHVVKGKDKPKRQELTQMRYTGQRHLPDEYNTNLQASARNLLANGDPNQTKANQMQGE